MFPQAFKSKSKLFCRRRYGDTEALFSSDPLGFTSTVPAFRHNPSPAQSGFVARLLNSVVFLTAEKKKNKKQTRRLVRCSERGELLIKICCSALEIHPVPPQTIALAPALRSPAPARRSASRKATVTTSGTAQALGAGRNDSRSPWASAGKAPELTGAARLRSGPLVRASRNGIIGRAS